MTAPAETLPVARTDAEIVEMLRRRRHELGVSQMEIDERIGWAVGYTGKVERPDATTAAGKRWGRGATLASLAEWAAGLGCALALIPLDAIDSQPRQLCFAFVDDLEPPPRRPSGKPRHYVHRVQHLDNENPDDTRRRQGAAAA